jgi:hypothetical protein
MIESSKSAGYLVLLVAMAGGRTDCAAGQPASPDGGGPVPDAGIDASGGGSPEDAATLDATSDVGAEDARGDDFVVDAADLEGAADAPASSDVALSAPPDAPSGDDGSATDPLSISPATSSAGPLIMQASCGAQSVGGQFTITNISGAPVTWSASDGLATPLFSVSPAGSTLAPGASVLVAVTGPPIPAVTRVGIIEESAIALTSASGGQTFTDDVVVAEAADGCNVMLTPASLDFGEVPVGSTATLSAAFSTLLCYGTQQGFSEPVVPMGTPFAASKSSTGGATVTFTPQATGAVQSTLTDGLVGPVICSAPSDYTIPLTGTGI